MENVEQLSLLEVALLLMEEKGTVVNIYDLINEVLKVKGLTDEDNTLAAKLYRSITTSSKFVYMGEENWDLKSRQSLDEFDKDGASFNPKDAYIDEDDEDTSKDIDDEDDLDYDDEDDEESEYDDEESENDDEESEENEYDEVEYDDLEEEDDEVEYDDSLDEDKYNKIMDDYEDLYEN